MAHGDVLKQHSPILKVSAVQSQHNAPQQSRSSLLPVLEGGKAEDLDEIHF